MAAAGVSPSSSPRLPSPPPFTEVQIGPKSPSVGESFGNDAEHMLGAAQGDHDGSTRRIRPGTKAADMAFGPPLVELAQLDSPFQLQEHLKALYHHFTKPEGSSTMVPITRDIAVQLAEPPEGVDRALWLYELCRFLTMKVNNLIIAFFAEEPPCSAQTCPEMRASEWQYLCAVHDPPKSCCAIDYCCHTLDWAMNILTSPKYFPSRLTLGSEAGGGPQASMRHLTNIFRRLYRIFAHAWFQHRDVFWQVEGHEGLYVFFKTVCDMYNLIPEDNYTVPAEADGSEAPRQTTQDIGDSRRLTILRKDDEDPMRAAPDDTAPPGVMGSTTRRHKHTPSTGSRVTTITESAEDNDAHANLPEVMEDLMSEESASDTSTGEETESTDIESHVPEESSVGDDTVIRIEVHAVEDAPQEEPTGSEKVATEEAKKEDEETATEDPAKEDTAVVEPSPTEEPKPEEDGLADINEPTPTKDAAQDAAVEPSAEESTKEVPKSMGT